MSLFERYSFPMVVLLLFTDDGAISLFFSSILTPRWGKRATLLIHFISSVAVNIAISYLPMQIASPLLYIFFFVVTCLCYQDTLTRKLLVQGLGMVGVIGCQLVVAAVLEAFGYHITDLVKTPHYHFLILIGVYALFYPYLFFVSRLLNRKFHNSKDMLYFALIPISEMIMLGALVGCVLYLENRFLWMVLFFCAGLGLASVVLLFLGMRRVIESTKLKMRYTWLQAQQKLQADYNAVLEDQLHGARKLRHDLLNYTHTLNILLEEGHYQEVKDCTARLQSDLTTLPQVQYCAHPVVNAVLCHKMAQARDRNISVEVHLVISSDCGIESADLIGLFSNLLDNAIEACAEVPEGAWLSLTDRHNRGLYTVTLRNSKRNQPLTFVDGKPVTQKSDRKNHGLGLEILEEIAHRYGGTLSVHDGGEVFTSNVLLQLAATSGEVKNESFFATRDV